MATTTLEITTTTVEPTTTVGLTTTISPTTTINPDAFITEWVHTTGDFTLPLRTDFTYDMLVDWGDGSALSEVTTYNDVNATHEYTAGTYQITITGTCGAFYMNNNSTNRGKLRKIIQWGDVGFISFQNSFHGCNNLISLPNGAITGSNSVSTSGFRETFYDCTGLTSIPSGLFDNNILVSTSGFLGTFRNCIGLTSIPSGLFDKNTAVSTSGFRETFYNCTGLTSIPSGLFDNNILVSTSGFFGTFRNCTELTSIPSGLFDNNTAVSSSGFLDTFRNCIGLTSIPSGLFDKNTAVSTSGFEGTFYDCTGLTSIPSGLFDKNTAVSTSGFLGTFRNCTELTSIPSGLFDKNTAVSTSGFRETFYNCTGLTSIPTGLFANNTAVSSSGFYQTFSNCTELTSIPSGLFDNNTAVSTSGFYRTFSNCIGLTSIPSGLFDNNILVSTSGFLGTFRDCIGLTSIPSGLFDKNTAVSTSGFCETFYNCTGLTSIPSGLFDNNILVSTSGFFGTFRNCTELTSIPSGLFDKNTAVSTSGFRETFSSCTKVKLNKYIFSTEAGKATRFLNTSVDFRDCFYRISFTGEAGEAPELWQYDFGTGTPTTSGCYAGNGNNGDSLYNYCSIPEAWGGSALECGILLNIAVEVIDTASESLTIQLSEADIPIGATLNCYLSDSELGIESPENIISVSNPSDYFYEATLLVGEGVFYVLVVYEEGATREELTYSSYHYSVEQIGDTIIDIVPNTNHKVLDDPYLSYNHGLVFWDGYVYGSSRGEIGLYGNDSQSVFKIKADDYSVYAVNKFYLNKNTQTGKVTGQDQLVYCKGFLWMVENIAFTSRLIRVNPVDLDYIIFTYSGQTTEAQPIGTDGIYLYVINNQDVIKIDVDNLLGDFSSYGYDGSAPVAMSAGTEIGSCAIIQRHPTVLAYTHSIQIDANYIYMAVTSSKSLYDGYDSVNDIYFYHLQKIDKHTMITVGDVVIPKCTDDMTQDNKYVYLAPEYQTAMANKYGSEWGLLAIRKSDLQIKYLKALHGDFNTNDATDRQAFGVQYFGQYILVQLVKSKKSIIINTSEVNQWGASYPIGGATEKIYTFQINGVALAEPSNELVLDSNGTFHANTWETNTIVYKFTDTELDFNSCPNVESYLVESLINSTILGGQILDTGGSEITETGFYYSKDPVALAALNNFSSATTTGEVTTTTEITTTLESESITQIVSPGTDLSFTHELTLSPGLYFFKAYATNEVGECYGSVVSFIVGNTVILDKDNDDAVIALENENAGHAVRCCKAAPGIADGVKGTVSDIHGNVYETVVINEIEWMAEDLRVSRYKTGVLIPELPNSLDWSSDESGALAVYNNDWNESCLEGAQGTTTTLEPTTTAAPTTTVEPTTTTT